MFTATADGLFADNGLEVEILGPPGGPANILRTAKGEAEFCLTSVHHYLTAEREYGHLPARFVAIAVQRSPVCAAVPADSSLSEPGDLAGRRVAGGDPNHVLELMQTLRTMDLDPPVPVRPEAESAHAALAAGEVDALVSFVDGLPRARRLAGLDLRAVLVGAAIYSSGLVAGDHVDRDVAARMRAALVAAYQRQREDPTAGLQALCDRYPDTRPAEAVEGWQLIEPYVFADGEPCTMSAQRWQATVDHLLAARTLPAHIGQSLYDPEFADPS